MALKLPSDLGATGTTVTYAQKMKTISSGLTGAANKVAEWFINFPIKGRQGLAAEDTGSEGESSSSGEMLVPTATRGATAGESLVPTTGSTTLTPVPPRVADPASTVGGSVYEVK